MDSLNTPKYPPKKGQSPRKQKHSKPKRHRGMPEGMPSRPLSAYNLFFKDERVKWLAERKKNQSSLPSSSGENVFVVMGREIGSRWRNLSSTSREKYVSLANEARRKYRKDMEEYNEKVIRESPLGQAALQPIYGRQRGADRASVPRDQQSIHRPSLEPASAARILHEFASQRNTEAPSLSGGVSVPHPANQQLLRQGRPMETVEHPLTSSLGFNRGLAGPSSALEGQRTQALQSLLLSRQLGGGIGGSIASDPLSISLSSQGSLLPSNDVANALLRARFLGEHQHLQPVVGGSLSGLNNSLNQLQTLRTSTILGGASFASASAGSTPLPGLLAQHPVLLAGLRQQQQREQREMNMQLDSGSALQAAILGNMLEARNAAPLGVQGSVTDATSSSSLLGLQLQAARLQQEPDMGLLRGLLQQQRSQQALQQRQLQALQQQASSFQRRQEKK